MSQSRLNHTMVHHIHKEKTDALSLVNIANEFVFGSGHRLKQFSDVDLCSKNVPVKSCGVYVHLTKTGDAKKWDFLFLI